MMKKFLIPALALAAASVAVPAMAQSYGHQDHDGRGRYEQDHRGDRDYRGDRDDRGDRDHRGDRDFRGDRYDRDDRYGRDDRNWQPIAQRRTQLQRLIDRGLRNGWLSRREARYVQTEVNGLIRLEYRYQQGGLSWRERQDLQSRYDRLTAMTREHRRDHGGDPH
jgi:hypothetical protein